MLEDGSSADRSLFEDANVDPVIGGFIRDWDAMEDLLHYVLYTSLEWAKGNEGQILFTDPLCIPKSVTEQLVQLMFETFNHIASRRFEIGGIDLTKLLIIKEKYSCCAEDEVAYEKTQRERYIIGEALFQPSILGLKAHGIVEQLVHSISTVSSENHRQLLENTILCGGITSMPGFEDRFQKEASLCSSVIRPSLVKPPEYMPAELTQYSAWVGGAILAKVVFPQNQHVAKGDYDEAGPYVVHQKCF
ncbi:hypothetical protein P3X46_013147 [Hevea brasiliensis]|uniref:Actin-related protein 7 n=1 Tax=Hevea brasiliensis TaxID=3981 RepID=A0ABQ9M4Q6_HEVBR|nr:hypothetical protein P3X46_013147 [Hevea brasiliensis]